LAGSASRRNAGSRFDAEQEAGNDPLQQITLTPFWRGRIIEFRDALSLKAHCGFLFSTARAQH